MVTYLQSNRLLYAGYVTGEWCSLQYENSKRMVTYDMLGGEICTQYDVAFCAICVYDMGYGIPSGEIQLSFGATANRTLETIRIYTNRSTINQYFWVPGKFIYRYMKVNSCTYSSSEYTSLYIKLIKGSIPIMHFPITQIPTYNNNNGIISQRSYNVSSNLIDIGNSSNYRITAIGIGINI